MERKGKITDFRIYSRSKHTEREAVAPAQRRIAASRIACASQVDPLKLPFRYPAADDCQGGKADHANRKHDKKPRFFIVPKSVSATNTASATLAQTKVTPTLLGFR